MQLIIDTADLSAIERINNYFPIEGVTTNPKIVAASGKDIKKIISGIRNLIGGKQLHVQVLEESCDGMLQDAQRIANLGGENTYIKIPVTPEGVKAIQILKERGYKLTATVVYTPMQALIAAKAGADYVAPYINRTENIGGDGVKLAVECHQIIKAHGLGAKVLGASFGTVNQVTELALAGVEAVTLPPELFDKLIRHPMTEEAVAEFIKLGKPYYDTLKEQ